MPCQDWGVAGEATSIYLGSRANFSSKIMFPYKMALISAHLTLFLEFLFMDHKKMVKIENLVTHEEK